MQYDYGYYSRVKGGEVPGSLLKYDGSEYAEIWVLGRFLRPWPKTIKTVEIKTVQDALAVHDYVERLNNQL